MIYGMSTQKQNIMSRTIDRYKSFSQDVYGNFQGFQRVLCILLMWVLSFAIVFTQYTAYSPLFASTGETVQALVFTILLTVIAYQLLKMIFYYLKRSNMVILNVQKKLPLFWFLGTFFGVMLFLLILLDPLLSGRHIAGQRRTMGAGRYTGTEQLASCISYPTHLAGNENSRKLPLLHSCTKRCFQPRFGLSDSDPRILGI